MTNLQTKRNVISGIVTGVGVTSCGVGQRNVYVRRVER